MKYLVLDFETRSECDLKRAGAFEYANHPSTQVLCIGWGLGTREKLKTAQVNVWSPAIPSNYGELIRSMCDPEITIVAHNAYFEQVITRFVLTRVIHKPYLKEIPISRWLCTASLARAMALPGRLAEAGAALGLKIQKDAEGHRLMLKISKPRRATKSSSAKWHESITDLKRLMEYCATDVKSETELFLTLPALNPMERKIWELDQKINWRGFYVDRPLVDTVLKMIERETVQLDQDTTDMTGGFVGSTTERDSVLDWLKAEGVTLPDLRAKTVRDALEAGLVEGQSKRLLEIRQAISKTSTAKYAAFEARSRHDSRVRDHLTYHAASTGRWGGAGVQPQNFPRGAIKNTVQAAEIMATGDLDLVRLIYGDPMSAFSSCLRAMIRAPHGKKLFCADYNAIEARVLFWLAKHEAGLRAFMTGGDLYVAMARVIYNKPEGVAVTKEERELGKRAILGCGYNMGAKKFKLTCKEQGNMEISEELAERAVKAYRSTHSPVPELWGKIERAAKYAVMEKKRVSINRTTWWVEGKFLYCELPSKRRLAYYGPEIRVGKTPWGENRTILYHWGVDSLTKQWVCSGTYGGRLVENICQAVARDLMAEAMMRVEDRGFEVAITIHDEILGEGDSAREASEFEKLMAETPAWAEGCPVKVAGWKKDRYEK